MCGGHKTIFSLVQYAKAEVGTSEFQWMPVQIFQHSCDTRHIYIICWLVNHRAVCRCNFSIVVFLLGDTRVAN